MNRSVVLIVALAGCAGSQPAPPTQPSAANVPATSTGSTPSAPPAPIALRSHAIALPGSPERVTMDYLAYDPTTKLLWVPAGNTKRVDVIDTTTGALTGIEGFATAQREAHGVIRYLGPSSASVGAAGIVFVGNRGDSKVCALESSARKIVSCVTLLSPPDGIAYVATTKELWVTTPKDKSLTVVDVSDPASLTVKAAIPLDGDPEGYAVDAANGLFFTNLENKDRTLVVDVRARKVIGDWSPSCGEAGPRGMAFDAGRRFLYVACTDHVATLDARSGKVLGTLQTGDGVDNIDYAPASNRLFVAAGKAQMLTVAAPDDRGALAKIGEAKTAEGARVVVADAEGRAYVADSGHGQILVIEPAR